MTAEDVCYSLNVMINKIRPALLETLSSVSVKSENMFCIQLSKDDPEFMQKIWDLEIMPDHRTKLAENTPPIGSGPFVFASRDGERQVVLTANENYYAGRPA